MCFNPRAHVGRDAGGVIRADMAVSVSIHAPAGARPSMSFAVRLPCSFNPRAHGGRDVIAVAWVLVPVTFQSTRPRGARRGEFVLGQDI